MLNFHIILCSTGLRLRSSTSKKKNLGREEGWWKIINDLQLSIYYLAWLNIPHVGNQSPRSQKVKWFARANPLLSDEADERVAPVIQGADLLS